VHEVGILKSLCYDARSEKHHSTVFSFKVMDVKMQAAKYLEMSVNSPRLRGVTLQKLILPCGININEG